MCRKHQRVVIEAPRYQCIPRVYRRVTIVIPRHAKLRIDHLQWVVEYISGEDRMRAIVFVVEMQNGMPCRVTCRRLNRQPACKSILVVNDYRKTRIKDRFYTAVEDTDIEVNAAWVLWRMAPALVLAPHVEIESLGKRRNVYSILKPCAPPTVIMMKVRAKHDVDILDRKSVV